MDIKKIAIGADHAGYELKNKIVDFLTETGYLVKDFGTNSPDSVDYPVIAKKVATSVANNEYDKGILICGTGVGMEITANKIKGIRAVVCSDTSTAKLSRQHNDANILCYGSRIIGEVLAKDITSLWLQTEFEGGRHQKRINLIEN